MIRRLPFVLLLMFFFASQLGVSASGSDTVLAISIVGSDLPGSFNEVNPQGFDISPDGKQIAVAFRAGEFEKGSSVWLGVWDITTKKLLSHPARIDSGLTLNQEINPHSGRDVRYTPDGETIVVQTGPRVLVLRFSDLMRLRSIEPMQISAESKYGPAISAFDISADGRWLAVLTRSVAVSKPVIGLKLVDLKTINADVEWTVYVPDTPNSITISSDGSRILLTNIGIPADRLSDVVMFDAITGRVVNSFQSGCLSPAICGASDARFWGKDRIVTVPKPATDASGHFFATALRVFDLNTGRLVREIHPKRFSSIGNITIATGAPALVTVNAWQTRWEIIREMSFRHSKPELVLFNLENGAVTTILHAVPPRHYISVQSSLRMSADGATIAVFEDTAIKVFRLPLQ